MIVSLISFCNRVVIRSFVVFVCVVCTLGLSQMAYSQNTPPTISAIGNQTTNENNPTGAIPFVIGDLETPADSLLLSVQVTNSTIVPIPNIVFGGSGTDRTLTITPATNTYGVDTITVNVSDGELTAGSSFVFTVNPVVDSVLNFRFIPAPEQAQLLWSPNQQPDFYKYYIAADTAPNPTFIQDSTTALNRNDTTANFFGLIPGKTYYSRIAASDTLGRLGPFSNQLLYTVPFHVPDVFTFPATDVSTAGAVLNGRVNPHMLGGTMWFDYGSTPSYGLLTPVQQIDSTSTFLSVVDTLTGLLPNATYHFRISATNRAGTVSGADSTFTTGMIAPTIVTEFVDSVNSVSAKFEGSVNANNATTTVKFEYGLTTGYGSQVTATQSPVNGTTATAVSASITGLTPNATYHYRISATNAAGTTTGTDSTFTTHTLVPIATTLSADTISATGATVHGSVNANNAATTVKFEYGLTTGYGTQVTATQSPVNGTTNTPVSAPITGLIPNTTYHYRISATNAAGTTTGTDSTFTTGTIAPTIVTEYVDSVNSVSAKFEGSVNANNAATTVKFEYGLTTGYGSQVTAAQSPVNGTTVTAVSAPITGLTPNTTYHYRISATNAAGTTTGTDSTFTTGTIVPTIVTEYVDSVNSVSAKFEGSVNANNAATTVKFEYGLTTGYGSQVTAAQSPVNGTTVTAVSAPITGLIPNTTYHYRISATNAAGTTTGTDSTFTTHTLVPIATTLSADTISATGATVHGSVNANNAATTVKFEYGLTTGYGTQVTATQSPVNGTTNTPVSAPITGLIPNTTYHYRISATNAAGTTTGTDSTFTTHTLAPVATTLSADTISATGATVHGSVNANNAATTVKFEYGLTTGYGIQVTAAQSPVNGTTVTLVSAPITGLTPNTTYHYRISATNAAGTTTGTDSTFTTRTQSHRDSDRHMWQIRSSAIGRSSTVV